MRATLLVLLLLGCRPLDRPWCDEPAPLPELKAGAATVREQIVSVDRERSFHIAFVAEGFQREELALFEALTRTWLEDFRVRMDAEVPGLTPMLNVSWIDFRDVAPDDGFVLGTCMVRGDTGVRHTVNEERYASLIPAQRFDVIVVVVNSDTRFVENGMLAMFGGRPRVMVNRLTDSGTFAHELGHSLFGLHDEYSARAGGPELVPGAVVTDGDLRATDSALFLAPNVSLSPTSPKFGGATTGVEGGMGFSTGVFHWGGACLMNDSTSTFCPVCLKAAQERVRARRSASVTNPKCGIRVSASSTSPDALDVFVAAQDWDGLAEVRLRLPDAQWTTMPISEGAISSGVFSSFVVPARDEFPVEAICVDRKGQQSQSRLDLRR